MRGSKNPRLFPEHWLTATISTGLSFLIFKRELVGIGVQRQVGQIAHEKRIDRALLDDRQIRRRQQFRRGSARPDGYLRDFAQDPCILQ
jgi:hypothetical protein